MFVIINFPASTSWNKFPSSASKISRRKKLSISTTPSLWAPPQNPWLWDSFERIPKMSPKRRRRKNLRRQQRERGRDVTPWTNRKMLTGGTGCRRRTNVITGSFRFTINISWTDTCAAWTKYSKPWRPSLAPGRPNSAAATTKKWRKNTTTSSQLSATSGTSTITAMTSNPLHRISRVMGSNWPRNWPP